MFDYKDEYIKAIQYGSVHTYKETNHNNIKLVLLNLALLSILVYLGFSYLKKEYSTGEEYFHNSHKTAVMGVSHDAPVYEYKDEKFIQFIHSKNEETLAVGEAGER